MRRWGSAMVVSLLLLAVGCSKPAVTPGSGDVTPPGAPVEPKGPQPAAPVGPAVVTPRLLLDLPLGDDPDQPGSMPGRVGGISPSGPTAFAAAWGGIYLADQAKGRVLHYRDGQPVSSLAMPWLDEESDGLGISPWGVVATANSISYTMADDGRLQFVRPAGWGGAPLDDGGTISFPVGQDGVGNRFERTASERGTVVRRVSPEGRVLAVSDVNWLGGVRYWYAGRDGALYAMLWEGRDRVERVRIYEVFPTVTFSSPPGGMDSPPPPVFQGRPVPAEVRLRSPNWAPVQVESEVDRWNLWMLLAAGPAASDGPVTMDATFADGSTLSLQIVESPLIQALRLSEAGLKQALAAAESVSIAIEDLPGTQLELTPAQRQELRESLAGAMPVNLYTPPHPLERPFPQHTIHMKGPDWEGTLELAGDRHLVDPNRMALVHSGRTAALVKGWLPVPELKPEQVGYLFLADKLQIGALEDLTRWKATVVRKLIHAQYDPQYQTGFREPITLTFWVRGEQRTVQVDMEGFTYAGKRYPGSGLTEITGLQGVP